MTKKTKFKSLIEGIESSNKKFERASQANKIVMIAKDVISLLAIKKLCVKHGSYLLLKTKPEDVGHQVSDILKMPSLPTCEVCAIGGVMFAATLRLNDVKLDHSKHIVYYNSPFKNTATLMSKRASSIFTDELLEHMEFAFEDGYYGYGKRPKGEARFKSIYLNLIKNKGKKFTAYANYNVEVYNSYDNELLVNKYKKSSIIHKVK